MTSFVGRLGPVRAFREIRRDYPALVLVLATGDLVASFGFSLIFPFLTLYLTQRLGATAAEAGLVLAGYSICSIASGAIGGWLADRVGRRSVMLVSVSITAVVIALMGQARDLFQIGVLTVALGLVDPAFIPAARAAIADVVEEARRPRAYSLLAVASAVGWIGGPSIGAGLATLGYPLLFTVAGLLVGAYAVIGLRWLPETRPGHATRQPAAPLIPPPGTMLQPAHERPGSEPPAGSGADRDRRMVFVVFLPIAILVHAATFQWVVILPIHASRDLAVPTSQWGILFSLNGVLIVLFQLRLTALAERFAKPLVMAASMVCYAVGYLVIVALGGPGPTVLPGLALTIGLVTLGEILLFPVEPAFVSDLSPIAHRGRYQGLFLAATGLGSAVGPPLGGYCLDVAPGAPLWLLTAASLGLAALALAGLARLPGARSMALSGQAAGTLAT